MFLLAVLVRLFFSHTSFVLFFVFPFPLVCVFACTSQLSNISVSDERKNISFNFFLRERNLIGSWKIFNFEVKKITLISIVFNENAEEPLYWKT